MSRKYKFHDQDKLYFISFATVHWIDIFVREEYMNIMIDSFKFCQEKKGLEIYGWCIMPSHIHMIIGSSKNKMEDIVRDMKSHTSNKLRNAIKNNVQESRKEWMIWIACPDYFLREWKEQERKMEIIMTGPEGFREQQHNQPIEIKDQEMFDKVLDYTHLNPVMAGFVSRPEDWKYSSAKDFCGVKGLIELDFT